MIDILTFRLIVRPLRMLASRLFPTDYVQRFLRERAAHRKHLAEQDGHPLATMRPRRKGWQAVGRGDLGIISH
jgi:hypothetical protein